MMLEYGIRKLLDLGSLTFAFGLEIGGESCHFLEGEIPVLVGFEGPMELWRFSYTGELLLKKVDAAGIL